MTVRLHDLTLAGVLQVAFNLREPDREEIFGLLAHDSPVVFAYQVIETIRAGGGRGRVVYLEGEPVAVVGFATFRPSVWQIILFGTEQFRMVALDCLKWIRATGQDLVTNHGGRRLQCESRQGHTEAHKFLHRLGARAEGPPMRMYGKDGSAYQRFVWLVGDNAEQFLELKGKPNVLHAQ